MYRVGQIWSFRARPGEDGATLTIVRVQSGHDLAVIVHVSLEGVHIEDPSAPDGFIRVVGHAPFTEDAITRSVTSLVGQAEALPPFEEGYRLWRASFDQGEAGAYTMTVAEAVDCMEQVMRESRLRPASR